jgi:oxygen-dependent protoporphyrinogen oxidase
MKRVRVIGAGINGLLAAYYLVENGCRVDVFEKSGRVGGILQTQKIGQHFLERAANAILADAEMESVARKIGLKLEQARPDARSRWIFRSGLKKWPLGVGGTFRLGRFLFKLKLSPPSVKPDAGESLAQWGNRVAGAEVLRYLLEPACGGIFAAPAEELSATLIYNYFFARVKKPRGALRGSVRSEGGMGRFADQLRFHLEQRGVTFHFDVRTHEKNDEPVVIATDVVSAAEILESWGDGRAAKLAAIPTADLISVNVVHAATGDEPRGFGVLFPRHQKIAPLGVLFNDFIFTQNAPADQTSSTWIYGGRSPQEFLGWSDERVLDDIQNVRENVLMLKGGRREFLIHRWPRALPLYGLEMEKILESLPVSSGSVHLLGNYLGEIGLNRFFHRAKDLAERISRS